MDIPPKRKTPDDEERKPPSDGKSDEAVDSNGSSSYKEETIATPSGKKALWFYQLVFVNLDLLKS